MAEKGEHRPALWLTAYLLASLVASILVWLAVNGLTALLVAAAALWLALFAVAVWLPIGRPRLRKALYFAGVIAFFLSPGLVVGEGGVAPAPAVLVLFLPGHFRIGAIPLAVVFGLAYAISSLALRPSRPAS